MIYIVIIHYCNFSSERWTLFEASHWSRILSALPMSVRIGKEVTKRCIMCDFSKVKACIHKELGMIMQTA
jgi:hypothetical protein